MTRRTGMLALAALTPLLVLAGCAGTPEATATTPPAASAAATSPAPEESASASPTAVADPTCETIIPGSTVSDFEEIGWTAQPESFRAGSIELSGGVYCRWGDYTSANDVQIYGWAPVDEAEADDAISELVSSGWQREEGAEGVYITESAETVIVPDSEGYGITYLFGDGWVKVAGTKQELILVEWPPR